MPKLSKKGSSLFKKGICHGYKWQPDIVKTVAPDCFNIPLTRDGLRKTSLPWNFLALNFMANQTTGYHNKLGLVINNLPPGFNTLTISRKASSGLGVCSIHSDENKKENAITSHMSEQQRTMMNNAQQLEREKMKLEISLSERTKEVRDLSSRARTAEKENEEFKYFKLITESSNRIFLGFENFIR